MRDQNSPHLGRRLARQGLSLAVAAVLCAGARANAGPCALKPIAGADISKAEVEFRAYFCDVSASARCDTRWINASGLMRRLASDPRMPNIGAAAYVAATAYVETGSKDFDPAATETLGPVQLAHPYASRYFGRGWIQLTHQDKYAIAGKAIGADLEAHPELALDAERSYEILVRGMTEGWIETYRSTPGGGAGADPIKLSDFINAKAAEYPLARAVINANCIGKAPCPRLQRGQGHYIADAAHLDAGPKAAKAAERFEALFCAALPTTP